MATEEPEPEKEGAEEEGEGGEAVRLGMGVVCVRMGWAGKAATRAQLCIVARLDEYP